MINIFENKYFTLTISIAITIITILIVFTMASISYKSNINNPNGITGLAINDEINDSNNQTEENKEGEIYSKKSYFIYILLVGTLSVITIALLTRVIFPLIKQYT